MQYALLSTSIVDRRLCTYFRHLHFVSIIFTLLIKLYIHLYEENCILINFISVRAIYVFEIVNLRYWNFIIIHRNISNNLIIETVWYQRKSMEEGRDFMIFYLFPLDLFEKTKDGNILWERIMYTKITCSYWWKILHKIIQMLNIDFIYQNNQNDWY